MKFVMSNTFELYLILDMMQMTSKLPDRGFVMVWEIMYLGIAYAVLIIHTSDMII